MEVLVTLPFSSALGVLRDNSGVALTSIISSLSTLIAMRLHIAGRDRALTELVSKKLAKNQGFAFRWRVNPFFSSVDIDTRPRIARQADVSRLKEPTNRREKTSRRSRG